MTVISLSFVLDTENAVFDDAPEIEIVRILTEFAAKVLGSHTGNFILRDSNGNRIGSASLSIHKDEATE